MVIRLSAEELSKRIAGQRQRQKDEKRWKKFRKAIGRKKPLKTERESFVFITTMGERIQNPQRRKVFVLYATQSGKWEPVLGENESAPVPYRSDSLPLSETGKKRAIKKLYDRTESIASGSIRSRSRSGLDLAKVVSGISGSLEKVARTRAGVSVTVEVSLRIRGRRKPAIVRVAFRKRHNQSFGRNKIRSIIWSRFFYQWAVTQQHINGWITEFSAANVRRITVNGKKINWNRRREKWEIKTKKGLENWGKYDYETIRISSAEWRVMQAKFKRK